MADIHKQEPKQGEADTKCNQWCNIVKSKWNDISGDES